MVAVFSSKGINLALLPQCCCACIRLSEDSKLCGGCRGCREVCVVNTLIKGRCWADFLLEQNIYYYSKYIRPSFLRLFFKMHVSRPRNRGLRSSLNGLHSPPAQHAGKKEAKKYEKDYRDYSKYDGMQGKVVGLALKATATIDGQIQRWPHLHQGEMHFCTF